ncbi:MAG: NADH dehydrogenase FAD-containing subunit [Chloroflexi bacterium]|nr:NADH dehydrogenase FAD-containing subunit [Chloroflexota bacterium]
MATVLILVLALPILAALVSLVLPRRLVELLGAALAVLAFLCVLTVCFAEPLPSDVSGMLRLDAMGAIFLLTVGLLYAIAAIFSVGYMAGESGPHALPYIRRYYVLLHLFGFTMLLVPLVDNLAILWIAIELTTISSALLVAIEDTDLALEAAWKYALIASAGLALALNGVIILYAAGTSVLGETYEPNWTTLMAVAPKLPPGLVVLSLLFAAAGFGTKAGLVPMHTWLPDAHSEAPSAVSGMLSGALLANAMYAVFRFATIAARAAGPQATQRVLLIFGILSLLTAAFFVLRQGDYKRLLAYSSIEHMGILALAAAFGTPLALYGLFMHVINHGAAKSLVFFGSGSVLRKYGTKEIEKVGGIMNVMPWTGPALLAGAFAISGLPPFGIFRSELLMVAGGFTGGNFAAAAFFLIFVNVAFLGIVWAFTRMIYGPRVSSASAALVPGEVSPWIVTALLLDLVVVVGIGLYVPTPLSHLLTQAATILGSY